jgi:BNR repeat-like domain
LHFGHLNRFKPLFISLSFLLAVQAVPPVLAASSQALSPQQQIGFHTGDQWEPTIAADAFGHVYILYAQYVTMPGCLDCVLPAMVLLQSNDNGITWQLPRQISAAASPQFDPQITVDPADRRTVYAAWLQNHRRDTIVAKSADFGQTWSLTLANRSQEDADKPVLAARGVHVYIAFNHKQKIGVASSHDGGNTFTILNLASNPDLGWSLASGATVDPGGNVYISWTGYKQSEGAKGPVNLYLSKSSDEGKTWSTTLMDTSGAPPDCSAYKCDWGYLGAQISLASDSAGTLYALWNAGSRNGAPERVYFSSSTTAGTRWSPKLQVSSAPLGTEHGFPAITAGTANDVRIAWMDTRNHPLWNTYYRSSSNGGATWSGETQLSSYVPGFAYIRSKGFSFPFGDYFGMAIDGLGDTQAVWGEGMNFQSPGSIWYIATQGKGREFYPSPSLAK